MHKIEELTPDMLLALRLEQLQKDEDAAKSKVALNAKLAEIEEEAQAKMRALIAKAEKVEAEVNRPNHR